LTVGAGREPRPRTMAFIKLGNLVSREPMPGFYGQFIHGDSMTVVHWDVTAGAVLPEHSHPHEQMSCLLDGEFEMTIDGTTERLAVE
jgi:quercetin dioxygenase-like cupin family protein